MKLLRLPNLVFYFFTLVLTVAFALGQQKVNLGFDIITLPQLAPAFAAGVAVLLYSSAKVSLNFSLDKTVFLKGIMAIFWPLFLFCISYFIDLNIGLKPSFTGDWQENLLLGSAGMLIGAIGEEIGWRGFLQMNLEKKYSALLSSIITGLLWGFWHIGHYKNGALFMFGFLLFTVSASIYLRRLLVGTNNNLIVSFLFHFAVNIGFVLFFKNSLAEPKMIWIVGVFFCVAALVFQFLKVIILIIIKNNKEMENEIVIQTKRALKYFTFFLFLFILTDCKKNEPEPTNTINPRVKVFLLDMIDIMKNNSINRKTIDWKAFTENVLTEAKQAATIDATEPAIKLALTQLGDNHSFVQTTDSRFLFGKRSLTFKPEDDFIDKNFKDIGYVKIGGNFQNGVSELDFAKNIQNEIKAQDTENLKGWIVDLRGNGGGNMWPMLAGVGPILGTGVVGYFINPDKIETPWFCDNGVAALGSANIVVLKDYYILKKPNPKVAVLIDGGVASSGEAVAIAFKGRPDTKFFGKPTYGVSTANQTYTLSNNYILFLTVSTMADRNKNLFGNKVEPDVLTPNAPETNSEAIKWLNQ
jgi:carboxyl-terminal processing protease